jgi:sialate O-acetylesterase
VIFTHANGGLVTRGATLIGFEVAGADGKFLPATGTIDGSSVLVRSPAVAAPCAVRYGWANDPGCNLANQTGLPASPFTTRE